MKYRLLTGLCSLVLFGSFLSTILYRYTRHGEVFSYSIDFTGGTQVLLKFEQLVSAEAVQIILVEKGLPGVSVREFANNELLIRVKDFASDAQGLGVRIRQMVQDAFPDQEILILLSESVGPGVGEMLRVKSVRAVIFGLIAMLMYIAVRFWSFAFAVGAVIALFHDAIAILFVFLLFNREISMNIIGAILAVLGYSINDTIVIFSRIRENIAMKKSLSASSLTDIVNVSLNQTLTRTILTSLATTLSVVSMFLFGGEALFDFSLALLIGVVFGTYSSIYIASPVMMLLNRGENK
jgi:preprotein translocase subunit SecF